MAGTSDRSVLITNINGFIDLILSLLRLLLPTDFIIRDIPQGENEDTTPFARSQKSSWSRSGFPGAVPIATAQAMQKIQEESISENTRKLLFEPRVGLFEKAAAPTPATKSDKAYRS